MLTWEALSLRRTDIGDSLSAVCTSTSQREFGRTEYGSPASFVIVGESENFGMGVSYNLSVLTTHLDLPQKASQVNRPSPTKRGPIFCLMA